MTRLAALRQVFTYLAVGGVGYLVNLVTFWMCLHAGIDEYWAILPCFVTNTTSNFLLNRRFTFTPSGRPAHVEFLRFGVVGLACLATNYATFHIFFAVVGLPAVPAQAVAVICGTPVGFLGSKLWAFAERPPQDQ